MANPLGSSKRPDGTYKLKDGRSVTVQGGQVFEAAPQEQAAPAQAPTSREQPSQNGWPSNFNNMNGTTPDAHESPDAKGLVGEGMAATQGLTYNLADDAVGGLRHEGGWNKIFDQAVDEHPAAYAAGSLASPGPSIIKGAGTLARVGRTALAAGEGALRAGANGQDAGAGAVVGGALQGAVEGAGGIKGMVTKYVFNRLKASMGGAQQVTPAVQSQAAKAVDTIKQAAAKGGTAMAIMHAKLMGEPDYRKQVKDDNDNND